jgi:aerobic carbon-monoxide dehydrogenase large subunit
MSGHGSPDADKPPLAHGVGARASRKEDWRFLNGRGQYTGDINLPGQQEVAFLRSPIAHGRLVAVTKPKEFASKIFVESDLVGVKPLIAESSLPSYRASACHALAKDKVRFVGEPVAMIVAATRAEAEDIAEKITLEIEDLPAQVDARLAMQDTATLIHETWEDNAFLTLRFEKDFAARSAGAPVVIEKTMSLARQVMMPLEGKAMVSHWDERLDQLVLYDSTQVPHIIRSGLALMLGLSEEKIRVIAPDVGGAFGYKCALSTEEVCVAWLAAKFRTPFRYVEDRREHLVAGANARQHHYKIKAFADERGRLLALDADIVVDSGAYSQWPWTIGLEGGQATGNLPGPYDLRGYRVKTHCIATNKPGFMPYRGVARTGVCFAMELTIDAIARKVGREPWEVRCENLVSASAMPYTNITNKHYDSGDYAKSLRLAVKKIDLEKWRTRQAAGEPDGRKIGIGVATYCEQSAHGTSVFASWGLAMVPGYEQAAVRVTPDGGLEIKVGLQSHGQGMETTLAQIANEILGIDIEKIRVVHGDTGSTPYSTGTYASRGIVMAGGAVASACDALVPRLINIGAHLQQAQHSTGRLIDGHVVTDRASTTIAEIASAWYHLPYRLPPDVDVNGLEASVGYRPKVDTGAFSYATHATVVAVDTEMGGIEILDYVIVEDCGKMINPMVVEGQIIGGTAQGIGTALYEESPYDANGQPLASTLADYIVPGPTEMPDLRIEHLETPSPYTRFGVKGMGEGGAIAPPAAIFNAVNDALRDMGAELNETPLTPRRLLEAIAAAKATRA